MLVIELSIRRKQTNTNFIKICINLRDVDGFEYEANFHGKCMHYDAAPCQRFVAIMLSLLLFHLINGRKKYNINEQSKSYKQEDLKRLN